MSTDNPVRDRLEYLQINSTTREILSEFMPSLTRELPVMLAAFYRHMQQHRNLATMFDGQATVDRTGNAQLTLAKAIFRAVR